MIDTSATDRNLALAVLVGGGTFALFAAVQFLRDTMALSAPRRRRAWDV